MRRLLAISSAAMFCVGAVVLTPGVAAAAPTVVCTVDDAKLPTITGITAVEGGYVVVDSDGESLRLFKLDAACKPTQLINDAEIDPNSPQDLAQTPDKTIWVADVGDDALERARVAVHKVAPGADSGQIFRLTYPDGKHKAAAMVVQPNGVPVIITKEPGGVAKLYTTAAPLTSSDAVPLKPAGTLQIPASDTSGGPLGPAGRAIVTGAALSPDGKKVLVRTYTDVYEWTVAADIPSALKGKPKRTPLPDEKDGQAITYTVDGVGYVTISAARPSALLEWTPAAPPEEQAAAKSGAKKAADDGGFSLSKVTQGQLGAALLVVGLLGLGLLVAGIVGIVRFRKQHALEEERDLDRRPGAARPRGPGEFARSPIDSPETVAFQRVGGSAYGEPADKAGAEPGLAAAGTAANGAAGASRGTVYGGGAAGGGAGGAAAGGAAGGAGGASRRGSVYGGGAEGAGGAAAAGGAAGAAGASRGTVYGGAGGGAAAGGGDAGRRGSVYGGQPAPPPGATSQMPAAGHARPPSGRPAGAASGQARPSGSAAPPGGPVPSSPVPGGPVPGGSAPGVARPGAGAGHARPAGPPAGQARPGGAPAGHARPGQAPPPPPPPPPGQGWSGGGETRPAGTTYGAGAGRPAAPPGPAPAPETEQGRSGRHDGSGRQDNPDETKQWPPQRESRDWRSRQPRD